MHIGYLLFFVPDVESAVRFYELFGLSIVAETHSEESGGLKFALLSDSRDVSIAFHKAREDDIGNYQCELFFECSDVDVEYERLTRSGVTFKSEPVEMPWGKRVATTLDPFGNSLGIYSIVK